jgi:hypothetical protein
MTSFRRLLFLSGLGATLVLGASAAQATWPAGAWRTIPGQTCAAPVPVAGGMTRVNCPYVSDTAHAAAEVVGYYIDYNIHNSGSNKCALTAACRQSWTGAAFVCGTASSQANEGNNDLWGHGFSTIAPGSGFAAASPWDYFFVELQLCSQTTLYDVWGVGYGGS